mgnify:CR=1 FL=1
MLHKSRSKIFKQSLLRWFGEFRRARKNFFPVFRRKIEIPNRFEECLFWHVFL